jgi:Na+-driven multidrug efflux pump
MSEQTLQWIRQVFRGLTTWRCLFIISFVGYIHCVLPLVELMVRGGDFLLFMVLFWIGLTAIVLIAIDLLVACARFVLDPAIRRRVSGIIVADMCALTLVVPVYIWRY